MNNMKEVKIIQSKTEPNKNHLWLSAEGLKQFKGNGWEQVMSGGGNGGGFIMEYIAGPFDSALNFMLSTIAFLGKVRVGNNILVIAYASAISSNGEILGAAISPDAKIMEDGITMTVKEVFIKGIGEEAYNSLPRITEEQFYNLNE